MATYYMRADGTAANKAAATGPASSQSACMNLSVHNSNAFAGGDTIKVSDQGGSYNGTFAPFYGISTAQMVYEAVTGESPTFIVPAGLITVNITGSSYFTVKGVGFANTNTVDGLFIYQQGNPDGIVFEDCTFDLGKATPTYGHIYLLTCTSAVNDTTFKRCSFTNSSGYADVVVPSSTVAANNLRFESCLFDKARRIVNQASGKLANWEFINCTSVRNSDYLFYFQNAGSTYKIVNNVFEDSSAARVMMYFSQAEAANIIATPSNLEMTNNIFWQSDNSVLYTKQIIYGGIHQELVPVDPTNYAIDPLLTAGNVVGAGSYAAGRGDSGELPSTDLSGNSWTAADVGCYANPAKTDFAYTSGTACFSGDSIMLGTGASDVDHTAYSQFADLVPALTVSGGSDYAIGGLYADAFRFFIDHVITTQKPRYVFTDIGLANIHLTKPTNVTNAQLANCIIACLQRIYDWGCVPIWLGMGSLTGNPPDNSNVTTVNTLVESACTTNGWWHGDWLAEMEENASWETVYYADLTTDLHPNDAGHGVIANVAYDIWVANTLSPIRGGRMLVIGGKKPGVGISNGVLKIG